MLGFIILSAFFHLTKIVKGSDSKERIELFRFVVGVSSIVSGVLFLPVFYNFFFLVRSHLKRRHFQPPSSIKISEVSEIQNNKTQRKSKKKPRKSEVKIGPAIIDNLDEDSSSGSDVEI